MNIVKGDLLEMALNGGFDVIVQGCNCHNTMGGGIAYTISKKFPKAVIADNKTIRGDRSKLGTYTIAEEHGVIVVNAYTQYDFGTDKVNVDYDAIRSAFKSIKKEFGDKRIGYPLIGCGLAGGNWDIVSKIIDEELDGCNHTLVIYEVDK